jgi:hypothetical protein
VYPQLKGLGNAEQEMLTNLPSRREVFRCRKRACGEPPGAELEVRDEGLGGFDLRERHLSRPFVKDYDAIPGNHPAEWEKRFDLTKWGLLLAYVDGELVSSSGLRIVGGGSGTTSSRSDERLDRTP